MLHKAKMQIPKWYSPEEIYNWINQRTRFTISQQFALFLAQEFQKAFEKGWEKSIASQPSVEADVRESCLTIIQCDRRYEGCFNSCHDWQPPAA